MRIRDKRPGYATLCVYNASCTYVPTHCELCTKYLKVCRVEEDPNWTDVGPAAVYPFPKQVKSHL